MARPCRIQFPNACHLTALRGADTVSLFSDAADARLFLDALRLAAVKHRVKIHAYAAAGNAALLLLETPDANLSAFMQGLQTAFARQLRESRGQSGSVFQGRFHAKVIEKDTVLASAAAWVHTLPLRETPAKISASRVLPFLLKQPASSFAATQKPAEDGFADVSQILKAYGNPVAKRAERHAAECLSLLGEGATAWTARLNASPLAIGSEEFVTHVIAQHHAVKTGRGGGGLRVHGRRKSGLSRVRVMDVVAAECKVDKKEFFSSRHGSLLRPLLAYSLYRYAGLTQQEISGILRVTSAAAVSLQIRRLLLAQEKDPVIAKTLARIEKALTPPQK